jgi:DNA-binding transcriptional LysR family regulator
MDRLDAMAVFAAIVDAGSLSAAGRHLNVPLATVSRKLADLEAHLKTRLITRSTRALVLTDAGRDYLEACRRILEQVDEAERGAAGAYAKVKGQLVVAAPVVFGRLHVVPVAVAFLELQPEVDLQLRLGDRNVNLIEEHVDLALRIGTQPDSSLVATPVGTIRRVVCASPVYLQCFGTPQLLPDLAGHRCITFDGLDAATAWTFVGADGRKRTAPVRSRLTVSTAEAAIDAAILGLGLTRVLSYQVAEALRDRRLVRVLAGDESAPVPASLIYPGQGRLPMKTRAFIDFAVLRLRERLSALDGQGADAPPRSPRAAPGPGPADAAAVLRARRGSDRRQRSRPS